MSLYHFDTGVYLLEDSAVLWVFVGRQLSLHETNAWFGVQNGKNRPSGFAPRNRIAQRMAAVPRVLQSLSQYKHGTWILSVLLIDL